MPTPLLATKLYMPPLQPQLVPRPHLIKQLNEGNSSKLILISAPAGYGKSSLLIEWVHQTAKPVVWLTLDEDDSNIEQFLRYLIAGLEKIGIEPDHLKAQAEKETELILDNAALIHWLNAINESTQPFILILDDYHQISGEQVHKAMEYILRHQPENMQIVLCTRADPPLPIGKLRVQGLITELRAEELRFHTNEAYFFFNSVMSLELSTGQVEALVNRTDGWIAGLYLAAISMKELPERQEFINSFTGSHRHVFEYLIDEILNLQSEITQQFLLKTSILDQLSGPLCDTVMEDTNSTTILEHLYRNNLFLISLDDEHKWFRYHSLFVEFLRKILYQQFESEQIRMLHLRAAKFYQEQDMVFKAMKYALAAQAFPLLALLLEQSILTQKLDSRLSGLLPWLNKFSPIQLASYPRLQVYYALALFLDGQPNRFNSALVDAKKGIKELYAFNERTLLREELSSIISALENMALGLSHGFEGDMDSAIKYALEAQKYVIKTNFSLLSAPIFEGLAIARYHQGQLTESAANCQKAIALAQPSALDLKDSSQLPLAAMAYVELSRISFDRNELDLAEEQLEKAISLCLKAGGAKTLAEAYISLSRLCMGEGKFEQASIYLQRAEEVYPMRFPQSMTGFRYGYQKAWLDLQMGNIDQVERWVLKQKGDPEFQPLPAARQELLKIMLSRIKLAKNQFNEVVTILQPLLDPAKQAGRLIRVMEIDWLLAMASYLTGDHHAAINHVRGSLQVAAPEKISRLFLESGKQGFDILMAFANSESQPLDLKEYAKVLLDSIDGGHPKVQLGKSETSQQKQPIQLTPRELDVLILICQGQTNKQIASSLYISLNTVKRHTSTIYNKLGVSSRTQAVNEARRLGLVTDKN